MTDQKQEILNQLHAGIATVVFTKANGERREMRCTLNETFMPAREIDETNTTRKVNEDVQRVWDIDKSAWRSFRWDSIINEQP
jgi:hypothetical protein